MAGSALFASCTSTEPQLDNDYKPLLPEETPEGTIDVYKRQGRGLSTLLVAS